MKRGIILRRLRRQLDLSQEYVALDLGISQKQVSRIEAGKAIPRINVLVAWCKILGITVGELEKLSDDE